MSEDAAVAATLARLREGVGMPGGLQDLHTEAAVHIATLTKENAALRGALEKARDAITDPANEHSVVCTVWMPTGNETLVDFIDAAIAQLGANPLALETPIGAHVDAARTHLR